MVKHSTVALLLLFALTSCVADGGEVLLLDFTLPTCGPCQQMIPTIRSLEEAGYPVRKVDASQEQAMAQRYGVTQVPCFVMLADGREVDRIHGPTSRDRLEQMFRQAERQIASQPTGVADQRVRAQSPDPTRPSDPWTGVQSPAATLASNSANVADNSAGRFSSTARSQSNGSNSDELVGSSVRLRVNDVSGHSYGTGTIIDTRSGEALIITCGHLFRESSGKGPVTVELFAATSDGTHFVGQVSGEVISYNLDRDIGLVSIRPAGSVPVAQVAPADALVDRGDRVTSVGCDHGQDPTAVATHVTAINRYQGPPNIEASGAPVEGRSGGGLFNSSGQLIGVCFAADYEGNEGLYASIDSIHDELDRLGLSDIYQSSGDSASRGSDLASQFPAATAPIVRGQEPVLPVAMSRDDSLATAMMSDQSSDASIESSRGLSTMEQAALDEIMSRAATSEVICIIRPNEPGGKSEVITLNGVSTEFIRALADRPHVERSARLR